MNIDIQHKNYICIVVMLLAGLLTNRVVPSEV